MFDDMIADMESNKKIKFCCYLTLFKKKKTQTITKSNKAQFNLGN